MPLSQGNTPKLAYLGNTPKALYLGNTLISAHDVELTPWSFFSTRPTDYAIEITGSNVIDAGGIRNRYYDFGGGREGTLIRAHPTDMFTNNTVQRLGRFWHANASSQQHVATHRRGGGVDWGVFLPTLGNNSSVYVINVTDEEYLIFDASDSVDGGAVTRPSPTSSFLNWNENDVVDNLIARSPSNLDTDVWLSDLVNHRIIFALSTQSDYRPYA